MLQNLEQEKKNYCLKKMKLSKMNVLRRIINPMGSMDAIEFLIGKLRETKNNAEFFDSMNKS
jgi:transcription termination factor Rho